MSGRRSAFGHWKVLLLLQALVVAVLMAAWWKASREPLARNHEHWLSLGIAAVMFSGAVNGLFVLGGCRAVALRRTVLYSTICLNTAAATGSGPSGGPQHLAKLAAGPAMTRYHRPTCALAAGKAVRLELRRDHEAAGRRPCGICRP